MLDKVRRDEALVPSVVAALGYGEAAGVQDAAAVAARLGKADLATSTVTEMTALAGVMGRHYALKQGLPQVRQRCRHERLVPRGTLPRARCGEANPMAQFTGWESVSVKGFGATSSLAATAYCAWL